MTSLTTSGPNAGPRNLLPNASFELDFGQGLPSNWTDMLSPLTVKLTATGQAPQCPPVIEDSADAPEGRRVVRIPVGVGQPGHLVSPVVPLKSGQAYTLSAYARSDLPSARLTLTAWTRTAPRRAASWNGSIRPRARPGLWPRST